MSNVRFINEFAQKFFGYAEKEIIGKNVVGKIVPQAESSGRDLAAMIKDIGRHPERYLNNENENMRRNGERVWIAWTNRVIYDDKGDIQEILCVDNDVTKRRETEEALRESEAKFRSVTEQSANMIFINKKGRVVYCNKTCEELMGYRREEFYSPDFDFYTLIAPEYMELLLKKSGSRHTGELCPNLPKWSSPTQKSILTTSPASGIGLGIGAL